MGAQGMRVLQRVITLKPDKEGIYLMTNKIVQELPELKSIQAGTANLFLKVRLLPAPGGRDTRTFVHRYGTSYQRFPWSVSAPSLC